jgi:hypothetical protein
MKEAIAAMMSPMKKRQAVREKAKELEELGNNPLYSSSKAEKLNEEACSVGTLAAHVSFNTNLIFPPYSC